MLPSERRRRTALRAAACRRGTVQSPSSVTKDSSWVVGVLASDHPVNCNYDFLGVFALNMGISDALEVEFIVAMIAMETVGTKCVSQ
ncbi:hypothetical protein MTR_2g063720 [Medicago truncatula]|uniref:Uncharacterized protein n=1 Tax=Medicago truncatula TaxID=3880 RepID=G7IGU9_MEDTR|nr:hypothetical protein MTR_2g063720 [Medicago truncatula]